MYETILAGNELYKDTNATTYEQFKKKAETKSASVASGARFEIQGSRFQTCRGRWIFSGRKNPEHKSSGRDFKLGIPSLNFRLVKEPES